MKANRGKGVVLVGVAPLDSCKLNSASPSDHFSHITHLYNKSQHLNDTTTLVSLIFMLSFPSLPFHAMAIF